MGNRDLLNKHPMVVSAIVVLAAVVAVYLAYGSLNPQPYAAPTKGYFTVDDGKTMFVESLDHVAPFMYQGKEAVRARVFSCDGGRTTFVAYLEKHTDVYKKARAEYEAKMKEAVARLGDKSDTVAGLPVAPDQMLPSHTYLKRPGETEWILWANPKGDALVNQKCPNGSYVDFVERSPG